MCSGGTHLANGFCMHIHVGNLRYAFTVNIRNVFRLEIDHFFLSAPFFRAGNAIILGIGKQKIDIKSTNGGWDVSWRDGRKCGKIWLQNYNRLRIRVFQKISRKEICLQQLSMSFMSTVVFWTFFCSAESFWKLFSEYYAIPKAFLETLLIFETLYLLWKLCTFSKNVHFLKTLCLSWYLLLVAT